MLKKVASLEGYLPAPKNKMMKSVRFLLLAVFVVAATPGSCVIPATCGSLLVTNEGKTSSDTQKEHQAPAEDFMLLEEIQSGRQKCKSVFRP